MLWSSFFLLPKSMKIKGVLFHARRRIPIPHASRIAKCRNFVHSRGSTLHFYFRGWPPTGLCGTCDTFLAVPHLKPSFILFRPIMITCGDDRWCALHRPAAHDFERRHRTVLVMDVTCTEQYRFTPRHPKIPGAGTTRIGAYHTPSRCEEAHHQ